MGGVATLVDKKSSAQSIKISEGANGNEYIITRHSQFSKPVNIINIYGDTESRTAVETIDRKWDEIMKEVCKIEMRDESVMIIGDLNKHVKTETNNKTNHGGKLIEEFLKNETISL